MRVINHNIIACTSVPVHFLGFFYVSVLGISLVDLLRPREKLHGMSCSKTRGRQSAVGKKQHVSGCTVDSWECPMGYQTVIKRHWPMFAILFTYSDMQIYVTGMTDL